MVDATDKDKAKYQIFKQENKYYIETRLTYTPPDGGKGYIVVIKNGEKPENTKK